MAFLHYEREDLLAYDFPKMVYARHSYVKDFEYRIRCLIKKVTSSTFITTCRGVTFQGLHYRLGNAVVLEMENANPRFGVIHQLFIHGYNLFIVYTDVNSTFCPHYNA